MKNVRNEIDDRVSTPEHERTVPERSRRLQVVGRALRSPLLILWILAGVCLIGGIIETVFLNGSPWEGLGAAALIASVTEIVGRVKRVPPWPWQRHPDS